MRMILFTAGCMIIATGLLLIGAYCHEVIEGIVSRLPAFQRHPGHHVHGATYRCCVHCQDGSPCEPRDAHREPCASGCDGVLGDQMLSEVREQWNAWHDDSLPPAPQGENPYPPSPLLYVSPEEWQSYLNAGRAVEPVKADGHAPWTGSQTAVDAEAEAEMDRVRYVRAQLAECGDNATADDLRRVLDNLRALPVYGEASQLVVDEAKAAPPFPYDPGYDNCAGTPGCGSERVFYRWYGADHTACPRCYMNVFGGEPDPSSVHKIAAVDEAGRLAAGLIT